MKTTLILLFLSVAWASGQDVFDHCGRMGDATDPAVQQLNILKTRWKVPSMDVDTIPIAQFLSATPSQFDVNQIICVTGYVMGVKLSGLESCECHSKAARDRDYHITICADAKHTSGNERGIVELTSRVRVHHPEWALAKLKKLILHKMTAFTGMAFWDSEHLHQSFVGNPKGKHNWRESCLEEHPVYLIEVLR